MNNGTILGALLLVVLATIDTSLGQNKKDYSDVVITRSEFDNAGGGSFRWLSELSDGSRHEQSGFLKDFGDEGQGIAVTGTYSYISPEGEFVEVRYIADENGFQPEGTHLPTVAPQTALPVRLLQDLSVRRSYNLE